MQPNRCRRIHILQKKNLISAHFRKTAQNSTDIFFISLSLREAIILFLYDPFSSLHLPWRATQFILETNPRKRDYGTK